MEFSAILLAGGRSRRMGGGVDKAFLDFGGEPLWRRQLNTLRALRPTEVLISVNAEQQFPSPADLAGEPPVSVVCDTVEGMGPLGGLASTLAASSCPLALVLGIDLPLMGSDWLARHLLTPAPGPATGVVPRHHGRFEPLAATYPAEVLALARRHLALGRLALQDFVSAAAEAGLVTPVDLPPDAATRFANLNTPADLAVLTGHAHAHAGAKH